MLNKLKGYLVSIIKKHTFLYESIKIISGYYVYSRLRDKEKLIFIRGATGDTYIQFLLLKDYLRQHNVKNYTIAGDSAGLLPLAKIFGYSNVTFIPARYGDWIEKMFLFMGGNSPDLLIPFHWSDNFTFNRCRIRMKEYFNFMDNYYYFSFNMKPTYRFQKPIFDEINENLIFSWQKAGVVKGKTVLISPDANSVTGLPVWFWNSIIMELQELGYKVFINCGYPTYFRAPNLFSPYSSCVPLLEYAGYFIGIRSGFCDIISTAKCMKFIIYPKKQNKVDYDHHRSEYEYSSLKVMNLCNDHNLFEVSTPLISNITDKEPNMECADSGFQGLEILRNQIMSKFRR